MKESFRGLILWLKGLSEAWLEVAVFLTVMGSAPLVHNAMTKHGVPDTWGLWVAVICIDLIIVGAGSWQESGLIIAVLLCVMNVFVILDYAGALSPALFSIAALLGTLGNYVRKEMKKTRIQKAVTGTVSNKGTIPNYFLPNGQLDPSTVKNMNVQKLREVFKLSHAKAKQLRKILDSGKTVDQEWLTTPLGNHPHPHRP